MGDGESLLQRRRDMPCTVPLRGVVQHYTWGSPKWNCLVASMSTEQIRSKRTAARAPPLSRGMRFAELWMGTHPNGHSSVLLPHPGRSSPKSRCRTVSGDTSDDEGAHEEWFLGNVISEDPVYWLGED